MAEINNSGSGQWSEVDASNTSASPNGWPSGTFFNQVEPIGQATMGAIKRFWDRINGTVTTTGASGTYTYTPVNASFPTALVQGETYSFKADKDSAGNDVININGLGAKKIYYMTSSGATQIPAGAIKTGAHIVGQIDTSLDSGAGGFLVISNLAITSTNPFSDGTALVKNAADPTKLAILSAASITTATTRTYTLPDANTTVVGTDITQTLTNKSLSDSTTFIIDDGDATKKAQFQCSGITTGTTRTYTFPDSSGTLALSGGGGVVTVKKQVFTSSGTYTPSTGMLYCIAEVVGGGGGGGMCSTAGSGGGGGGGGGYGRSVITAATIGASQTVTIGAAGTAGASNSDGGTGGTSSLGALISCTGGSGGTGGAGTEKLGGAGGASSSADMNVSGGYGDNGLTGLGGSGGSSYFGGGGRGGIGSNAVAGQAFGSGGGGCNNGVTGAAGKAGVIFITEFCSQ